MTDRGSALLETLVVGFTVVLVVAQCLAAVDRLVAAGERAEEAARVAATTAARHGDADDASKIAADLAPDAEITATGTDETITVEVVVNVTLIGVGGAAIGFPVRGVAAAPISPYRSDP